MIAIVKYFGLLAEKAKMSEEQIDFDFSDQTDIREFLEERNPFLKNQTYKIAIDCKITNQLEDSKEFIEIAVLPPFAGG